MAFRGAIPDFQLANPLYIGAQVTFFTADANGVSTGTQATLFAAPTGSTQALNPQTLDSEGKFVAPVYIETPVIAQVVGATVGSHTTGVINARGTWRSNWAAGTVYFTTDLIADPASGNIYTAGDDYTSSGSIATDIAAGHLILVIDQSLIISGGAARAIKVACQAKTTAAGGNIALSGLQIVDGYQTVAGDRVLVDHQTNAALNGIYNAAAGAWTRASDADASTKFSDGCIVYVLNGTLHHNQGFQFHISSPFTLGTSSITVAALEMPSAEIEFRFGAPPDGTLTTGIKGYSTPAPFDMTIDLMTILADAVGSMVCDLYKAAFPTVPNSGNSITASAKPTLSAQQVAQNSTLTGWTLLVRKGDVIACDVLSVSGIKFATLTLRGARS